MPVHGQLGALRLVQEDGGRSLRPQSRWKGLGDNPRGLAVNVKRRGDSKRLSEIHLGGGGSLDLPGESGPHVLLAGEGPGQLPGGAGEVAGGVLLLLEVGERGSLAVELAVPIEGAVPLGMGGVPGGLADVAPVPPQHGAGHQAGGVLHGVALILNLGLSV